MHAQSWEMTCGCAHTAKRMTGLVLSLADALGQCPWHPSVLPELRYKDYHSTPVTDKDGNPREVDDFEPRAQLKKLFKTKSISLQDRTDQGVQVQECSGRDVCEGVCSPFGELGSSGSQKGKKEPIKRNNVDTASKAYNDYDLSLIHI